MTCLLAEHGVKRALNVIIRCDEKAYGVLEVDSLSGGKFDEADVAFMESFAAILGVALQRDEGPAAPRGGAASGTAGPRGQPSRQESLSTVAGLLSLHARSSSSKDVAVALRAASTCLQNDRALDSGICTRD